mgnify:CR=1 FL=1
MIFNEPEENLCSSAEYVGDKINHPWDTRESSVGEYLYVKRIQEIWRCEEKCLYLHKIGGISAIEASFIAFDLHNLCIRLAAARHNIQASLMILLSTCTIFA